MSAWMLISQTGIEAIAKALNATIDSLGADEHVPALRDALHTLEAGLNTTDAMPSDYEE